MTSTTLDDQCPASKDGAEDRMTPAKLRVVREHLGLTHAHLARLLDVHERTVRSWETGRHPIPDGARVDVEELAQTTADMVAGTVRHLRGHAHEPRPLRTFRTDADHAAAHPGTRWSAGWHRAVVGRVADEVPGLLVVWHDAPAAAVAVDLVHPA